MALHLDAFAIFAAVAETGSFTRGAARVGMPKSSVTRAIAALEEELGERLLQRTTRTVTITPAGRKLLEQVRPHVTALARIGAGEPEDDVSGTLRVTTLPELGAAVLAEVVTRYTLEHPRVRVEAFLTVEVVDLVAEGYDFALRATSARTLPDSPHLTVSRLGSISLGMYASPAYFARAPVPRRTEELAAHDLVGLTSPAFMQQFGPLRIVANDMPFARAVIRAGGGIGVLPVHTAAGDVADGALLRVLPDWTAGTGHVWAVTPHGRRPPKRVTAFRAMLTEALAREGLLVRAAR